MCKLDYNKINIISNTRYSLKPTSLQKPIYFQKKSYQTPEIKRKHNNINSFFCFMNVNIVVLCSFNKYKNRNVYGRKVWFVNLTST